jgi:hypothetical protein
MPDNNRDYSNRGVLFVNDRRSGERDPDLKGNGSLNCPNCGQRVEFWVNAWNKIGAKAGKFLSLSFRAKTGAAAGSPSPQNPRDADIPWK